MENLNGNMDFNTSKSLLDYILDLLPDSPFLGIVSTIQNLPYLGYLNWFFPVGDILQILVVWLGAVGTFYVLMFILRWVKWIG